MRAAPIIAVLLFQSPAVVAAPASSAPFGVLSEAGTVFEYRAKVVVEELARDRNGDIIDDADPKRTVTRPKVRLTDWASEQLPGARLVELRTNVSGTVPEKLFTVRWIAITARGVYDLASKKPSPQVLAKLLRREPKWPATPPAKTCEPDRDEIDTGSALGRTYHTKGSAGSRQIRGRRAICRCYELEGGADCETQTECIDPLLGFVQLSYSSRIQIEQSSYWWELNLIKSRRGPSPAKTAAPGKTGAASTPWPALDLGAVLPKQIREARRLYHQAKVSEMKGAYKRAVDLYTQALKANPAHLVARFYLASAYEHVGQRGHAIRLLSELAFQPGCCSCRVVFNRVWLEGDLKKLTASPQFKRAFGVAAEDDPPPAPASPAVQGGKASWPALDLRAVPAAVARRATAHNNAGLRRHRAGDYRGAIALFAKALKANPGHLLARYNLACAFARAGDKERALSLLRELAKAGCPECMRLLGHARSDKDMDGLRSSDEWKKLTAPSTAK